MAKEKRGVGICLGCINEFKNIELFNVSITTKKLSFTSIFCEKCVKKKNFPEADSIEVGKKVSEPKKTKKKTTTKKKK